MAQAWPRALRIAIVVALAALVVVLTLSFRRDPRDIRTGTVGKPAAAFTLQKLDGSGELRVEPGAKVYVLNFWASWCIPCKEENPALVRMYERYRGSDVEFIGVLYQDSAENGRAYVRDNGVVWPTVNDENGRVAFSYGVRGIPETFFVGRDGVIAGRHYGPIDEVTLARAIECVRGNAPPGVDCLREAAGR
jgi:cytochrome c biogenesis protein CcmG/thiol:disulfide interchange protein DsbE